jgi:molecular chaperone Hsp33
MAIESAAGDIIQPFQIETLGVRGRLVRLGPALARSLRPHGYPAEVDGMVSEMVALAVALASMLKYDGVFTMQTRGDGPIGTLLADVATGGGFRSYCSYDRERLKAAGPRGGPVPRLLGAGHIAFTVDQGPKTERYQGVTALTGATLADCAEAYFRQSEQLATAILLAAGPAAWERGPRAAAFMIQRFPGPEPEVEDDDHWRRAVGGMSGLTPAELLDGALAPADLLLRHYRAEDVRVFRPRALRHACRCSRRKVEAVLRALPRAEVDSLFVDGLIKVTCEFCKTVHSFDRLSIDELFAAA